MYSLKPPRAAPQRRQACSSANIRIYKVVCDFLFLDRSESTLACLARTASAFEEPALDALWKVISNLEPLCRLLPDSMWILEDDPMG